MTDWVKTKKELDREREIDEKIAAGWGWVPGDQIPDNWRELNPPKTKLGRPTKKEIKKEDK